MKNIDCYPCGLYAVDACDCGIIFNQCGTCCAECNQSLCTNVCEECNNE